MAGALLAVLCMIVIPLVSVVVLSAVIVAGRADKAQGDE
jgi:L-cystine uptake protein TcyP (sodium:dicarboxylate symporter family)